MLHTLFLSPVLPHADSALDEYFSRRYFVDDGHAWPAQLDEYMMEGALLPAQISR